MKKWVAGAFFVVMTVTGFAQQKRPGANISDEKMWAVFEEVKTPYKYGIVLPQPDKGRMVDSHLITSSEAYDKTYAHKTWVIKWKGVVYHF